MPLGEPTWRVKLAQTGLAKSVLGDHRPSRIVAAFVYKDHQSRILQHRIPSNVRLCQVNGRHPPVEPASPCAADDRQRSAWAVSR